MQTIYQFVGKLRVVRGGAVEGLFDILLNLGRNTKAKGRVMACLDSSNYDSAARGGMYITTGRFGGSAEKSLFELINWEGWVSTAQTG